MKKLVVLLFAVGILLACQNKENKEGNLHLSGNIKGLKQGKLYIQKLQDTILTVIDTIQFDGESTFESHITIESPEMLYLFLDRGQTNSIDNNLSFFAEPGKMTIDTDLESFFANAVIKGSKNHELFEQFKSINTRFNNQQLELLELELNAKKNNNVNQMDSIQKEKDKILKRKYLYAINFALTQKDYEVSPYIALSEFYDAQLKYLDTIQKSVSPKVAKSKYGKMLENFIAERKKSE